MRVNGISTYIMYLANCPITVSRFGLLIILVDSILIPVIDSTLRRAYRICDTWKLSGSSLVALINFFLYKISVVSRSFLALDLAYNYCLPFPTTLSGLTITGYSLLTGFPLREKESTNGKNTPKPSAIYIRWILTILHYPHLHSLPSNIPFYLYIHYNGHFHPLHVQPRSGSQIMCWRTEGSHMQRLCRECPEVYTKHPLHLHPNPNTIPRETICRSCNGCGLNVSPCPLCHPAAAAAVAAARATAAASAETPGSSGSPAPSSPGSLSRSSSTSNSYVDPRVARAYAKYGDGRGNTSCGRMDSEMNKPQNPNP